MKSDEARFATNLDKYITQIYGDDHGRYKKFADDVKISAQSICHYVNGRHIPERPRLVKIAKFLKKTVGELLGIE